MIKVGNKHIHKSNCGNSKRLKIANNYMKSIKEGGDNLRVSTNRLERYRIPPKLIEELFLD